MKTTESPKKIELKVGGRTREDYERAARTKVFDYKIIVLGTTLFLVLGAGAYIWKLSANFDSKKKPPEEFEFTVDEPDVEEFELKDPQRDILQEMPEEQPDEVEEMPDIQMTVQPTEVEVTENVVQTKNIEVEVEEIDLEATEIDIEDAPEEISEISKEVTHAINPIAADAPSSAEIFKYKKPSPRDKPLRYFINRAPQPSRNLKVMPKMFGEIDAPTIGELGPANVNLFGTGDFFRTMARTGGVRARSAVDAALHWLAIHQEPNGIWHAEKYEGQKMADAGVSGLALLAFMGGGHTPRQGEYRRNVLRGLEEIIRRQKDNSQLDKNMYAHAICTIALCEAYGRARDERYEKAARKAVAFCEDSVGADGGWRYQPKTQISDMSVVGWFMMALKTAKLAGIKFDHAVYSQGLSYVDSVTDAAASKDSTGEVGYTFAAGEEFKARGHPALTCAAMMVRQFSGMGVKSHLLVKGAELTKKNPPNWKRKNFYYWYYATYAMHSMGGEYRLWWNRRIRDLLIQHQCREGDNAGSWDPVKDSHGERAGRVYTTALGALCLEVYYRYSDALNSFGVAPDIDDLFLQ